MKPVLFVVLAAAIVIPASGSAQNPWNLRCQSMPTEQRAPTAVRPRARAFFPWAGRGAEDALQSGRVFVLALSTKSAISRDGDDTDSAGYYLHRALIAISPAYAGEVVVQGHRLGRPGRRTVMGFSTNGATHCSVSGADVSCAPRALRFAPSLRVPSRAGWRIVETELRIGRTGCFGIVATGPRLHAAIPLAVPGPDWGTPGW